MITKQVGEIFADLKSAATPEEKIAILRKYVQFVPVRELIRLAAGVDPLVAIPDTEPPYKQSSKPYPYNDSRLLTSWKMFRLFRDLRAKSAIVQTRFIQLLEALHKEEAELLVDAHLRRLDFGLTREQLVEAFPELGLPPEPKKEEPPAPKRGRKKEPETVADS